MNKINKKYYKLFWDNSYKLEYAQNNIRFKMVQLTNELSYGQGEQLDSRTGTPRITRSPGTPISPTPIRGGAITGFEGIAETPIYTQAQVDALIKQQMDSQNATYQSTLQTSALSIAQQIVEQRDARAKLAEQSAKNGRTMTRFAIDDVVPNVKTKVSTAMWSNNTAFLKTYYTSSDQSISSRQYYIGVYQEPTSSESSELQFSIAYGHRDGLGSPNVNGDAPSRAIYYQYRNILLNPNDAQFTLGDNRNTDSIFVLSIARNRLKDKLDPGNWELAISGSNGKPIIHLVDDSNSNASYTIGAAGRVFNIVSGTIYQKNTPDIYSPKTYYGLAYPDMGVLVLDANTLNISASIATSSAIDSSSLESGASASFSIMNLFRALSGSGATNLNLNAFAARNEETVTSTHYFVRVKNGEYNYSNNPTFVTGSLGDLKYEDFKDNPNVYITTVGLYNDSNELLAVAKLSRPLLKNFDLESLIKIRLDF